MGTGQNDSKADESQFAMRLAKIRSRFQLRLADGIRQTDAALPRMAGDGSDAADAVATAYRWFHEVGGLGATVGCAATGRLAKSCEAILAGPFRAQCGLSADGLALLTKDLESLRIIALTETNSTDHNRGSTP
jgi:hypothetical protein